MAIRAPDGANNDESHDSKNSIYDKINQMIEVNVITKIFDS